MCDLKFSRRYEDVPSGGAREGAGAPKTRSKGREWWRTIVDDPARREAAIRALDAELAEGKITGYMHAFEHGYGRPPQGIAIDARMSNVEPGEQIIYAAIFAEGDSVSQGIEAAETAELPTGAGE
jgi:hypothetical protein